MFKKLMSYLVCASLILSLSTGWTYTKASKKAVQAARKTVTLMSFPDISKVYMEENIKNAKLDFDVKIIEVPQNQYENKIKMAISSGQAPDLVLMDAPNIASYANSGALEPLDKYWDKSDFNDLVDASKSAMQWKGKIWASPLNESNVILFYNKDVFAEAGIKVPVDVKDAWTFEQLLDACKKVVKKDGNKTTRYAIQPTMFSVTNKNEGMTYEDMLWLWWTGGDILNPDATKAEGYFNSDKSIKGIQFFADLYKNGYAPKEEIQNSFETGKVAMWIDGPWMIGIWKQSFPKLNWGAMPLPHDAKFASPAGSWNVAITAKSKNKAEAYKVIQALTSSAASKNWCAKTGNLPARKSVLKSDKSYTQYPFNIINQQLVSNAKARPVTPVYPQISDALMDCFNSVAFGKDVNTAVKEATQKMEKAFAKAKK
jgi:fructooligosaccharide transport system substrate-binding protein